MGGGIDALAGETAFLDVRLAAGWKTKNLAKGILILLQGCIEECKQSVAIRYFNMKVTFKVAKQ